MIFDEWFHKEYEPADLQIKQCAERNEVLHIPATVYLEELKKAFEAGLKDREAQIEKMKCCSNCKNEGDYREPYRYGTGWCNICKRHKVAKGNFDKWEIKEK